jgi:FkbM family methyltransferase
MTINNLSQANQFYDQVVPAAIHLCRDWYGLKSLEFKPRDGSPLQDPTNSSVRLVADSLMCPTSLGRHRWQIEELEFAKRVCIGREPITLIDIGANMGLFSRQLLIAIPAIAKVYAYEPERENFTCLSHNLAPFDCEKIMIEAAISDNSGEAEFYIDPTNSGNYSLAASAMPPSYAKIIVKTLNASTEWAAWVEGQNRIFYKSDTEGLDEWVTTLIRPQFWPRVFAGMIELWNIAKKPSLDSAALSLMLNSFPNKAFLANADTKVSEVRVSTVDIFNYINSRAQPHRDLAFWR